MPYPGNYSDGVVLYYSYMHVPEFIVPRDVPYNIGCEFFKDYKDNGYNPVSLQFDWKQVHTHTHFQVAWLDTNTKY